MSYYSPQLQKSTIWGGFLEKVPHVYICGNKKMYIPELFKKLPKKALKRSCVVDSSSSSSSSSYVQVTFKVRSRYVQGTKDKKEQTAKKTLLIHRPPLGDQFSHLCHRRRFTEVKNSTEYFEHSYVFCSKEADNGYWESTAKIRLCQSGSMVSTFTALR